MPIKQQKSKRKPVVFAVISGEEVRADFSLIPKAHRLSGVAAFKVVVNKGWVGNGCTFVFNHALSRVDVRQGSSPELDVGVVMVDE